MGDPEYYEEDELDEFIKNCREIEFEDENYD